MTFENYLREKKIDSEAFREAEESLWAAWKAEFEQISPTGFTAQKLYLINPVRRKYTAAAAVIEITDSAAVPLEQPGAPSEQRETEPTAALTRKPQVARPVFKPKPKP